MEALSDRSLLLHVIECFHILSEPSGWHHLLVFFIVKLFLEIILNFLLGFRLEVIVVLIDQVTRVNRLFVLHLLVFLSLVLVFSFLLLLFRFQSASFLELSFGLFDVFFVDLFGVILRLVFFFLHRHVITLTFVLDLILLSIFVVFIVDLICGQLSLDLLNLLVIKDEFSSSIVHVMVLRLLVLLWLFAWVLLHLRIFNLLLVGVFLLLLLLLLLFLLLLLLILLAFLHLL